MTGMPEHAHRHAQHRQPRGRRVDYTRPGFTCTDRPCPTCGGAGHVDTTPDDARHPALTSDAPCPTCRPEVTS